MNLGQTRQSAVHFLAAEQRADGRFTSYASAGLNTFSALREQPSIFSTILIFDCLHGVAGTTAIRKKCRRYLLQQRKSEGSWNYWDQSSRAASQQPYPDDLDDTACALAALTKNDSNDVDGAVLGQFARLLVASEQQPGGPYNTWLADRQATPQSQHVDLAVNANIGYALSLQGVSLKGLNAYIAECIAAGAVDSDYYVGRLPLLYFLTRWYHSAGAGELRVMVEAMLATTLPTSALQQALLLSSACQLVLPADNLAQLVGVLQASHTAGHWESAAFYIDPVYDNKQHYGGSAALTTAFVLEALARYDSLLRTQKQLVKPAPSNRLPGLRAELATVSNIGLRREYSHMARQVCSGDVGSQISKPASLLTQASWQVPVRTLHHLNWGSLNGWIAYTLYDNFLDSEGQAASLNVANLALRRSLDHYLQALPDNEPFKKLVRQTFDTMDSANAWELQHARATVTGDDIRIKTLPDYGTYQQLAERSLGHSLAGSGLLLQVFNLPLHECYQGLQTFFKHFLIARQLNDDAHDWETDLRLGHITAVVALLLKNKSVPYTVHYQDHITELRQQFWSHTINETVELITQHIAAGRQALAHCEPFMNTAELRNWLAALEKSATAALATRDQTLQFVQAYTSEAPHA